MRRSAVKWRVDRPINRDVSLLASAIYSSTNRFAIPASLKNELQAGVILIIDAD